MEPGLWSKTAALCPGGPALLLWVSTLSCSVSSLASPSSSLVPQLRTSYNSGRTFLGLDKCNACIGTSICKKFFKEEIRFDIQLASRLGLPPDYLPSYPANYSDDSKTWRPVELLRLVGKQQSEISDRRICASAAAPNTCSIERILRKTGRFQKWLQAKRLTPDLVQGLPSPFLRCPSQRLLDRVVRRYAEVADAGSIFMDHFTDRDKLRLLYTLAVNPHPIVLQAADLAYQLLSVLESLRSNDLNYFFYFTHVDAGMFGIFNNGQLFIRDASALGVIDKQEGNQAASRAGDSKDIFSCLVSGCQAELPPCNSIPEKQGLVLACGQVLPRLLHGKFPSPVQQEIDAALARCGEATRPDPDILGAASWLKDILRPLRTCDPRFAYRYPDCKYNDKF
ncbi:divergent protein kinase domain 2B isoform X2 [Manis pentadactyla]|uniref:divergent protein kinase domain 2B isoform X2 n=1 Tax=Manis pentadactyla TaxID=143292 RepID=UPI00255D0A04|nr:divergent protein kinase domain 2B isoform X2 [Manis pentadactyla]